jgi:uncharacterized membrane protein
VSLTTAEPVQPQAAEPTGPAGVIVGRASAWWVLIAGVIGLTAAGVLLIEKISLLQNPAYVPSCSINPVVSCGSVIITPQAAVFGPPNPLYGVIAFTVVLVTGVLAVGGVRLPRWYWVGLMIGTAAGVVFVHWLIFQSLYRIGALCPYCMVVWSVTVPLLVVVSSIALQPLVANPLVRNVYHWRWPLVVLWFTAVLLAILVRFWDFWSTLI